MKLEFHQLDHRHEVLRVRHPQRQRQLLTSLATSGQQTPIIVVAVAALRSGPPGVRAQRRRYRPWRTRNVEILEQRGIRPCLVNARHMKNVPGRRTDSHECQWLQFLHSVGLLRDSFRPQQDVCAVRVVLRHRSELVMAASQHVQDMHKALTQMNLNVAANKITCFNIDS